MNNGLLFGLPSYYGQLKLPLSNGFKAVTLMPLTAGCSNHVLELYEKLPGSLSTRKIMHNIFAGGTTLHVQKYNKKGSPASLELPQFPCHLMRLAEKKR